MTARPPWTQKREKGAVGTCLSMSIVLSGAGSDLDTRVESGDDEVLLDAEEFVGSGRS